MVASVFARFLPTFGALAKRIDAHLSRYLPRGASLELHRRARVILAFAAIMNVAIGICAPLDFLDGAYRAAASQAIGVGIVDIAIFFGLRRGKAHFVGHFITGIFVVFLVVIARDKGALLATEIAWQCAAIVFAVLVVGPRGALLWTLVAEAGLIVQVRAFDPTPFHGKPLSIAHPVDYAIDLGVLYIATWGLAFAFDRARVDFFRRLKRRNDEIRRVLEHAHDGLLTIDRDGLIGAERSKRADDLLGDPPEGATLWDVLAAEPANADRLPWLQMGWESVLEDILPREIALGQMPPHVILRGRTLSLRMTVIEQKTTGAITGALVVLHDITEELARERAEQARRDLLAVFEHLRSDADAVSDFVKEMDRLATSVVESRDNVVVMRDIHTIKGSAALFGVQSMADLCHAIEERCAQNKEDGPSEADRALLANRWGELSRELGEWASAMNGDNHLSLARTEVEELRQAIAGGASPEMLLRLIARWELMPLSRVFARLARQGKALAKKLGKDVDFVVEPADLRVDGDALSPVFSSLVHAVRNAIDHGIASPDDRVALGKPPQGGIVLHAEASGSDQRGILVEIRDDGEGIDWDKVREKARAHGLPAASESDLVDAILSDGFSTRDVATEISGRGVGLAALRDAAEHLGGSVTILSQRKIGSRLQVRLPNATPAAAPRPSPSISPIAA